MTSPSTGSETPTATSVADAPAGDADVSANTFSTSMVVSGIRCLLTYIVFPWLLPLLGVATGFGSAIGLVVGVVAIWFNIASIRRMRTSQFRWRNAIIGINIAVIGLLLVLIGLDIADLT